MAVTDKEQGVWINDQVYNKINQGSIWNYSGAQGEVGSVWSWGKNLYGSKTSDNVNRSSPVLVLSGTFSKPFAWDDNTGGINTSGELWILGSNVQGELGQNDRTNRSSPVQVGSGTDWAYAIGSKNPTTAGAAIGAVKTDGTMWSWGYNNYGQLGHNNLTTYSSPTQIPGTYLYTEGSFAFTNLGPGGIGAIIKTDGSLMMMGNNTYGQLGQNNRTSYSSPKQVPGTNWAKVSSDHYSTGAINTSGELYMWGLATQGQIGNNDVGGGPYWSGNPVKHKSTPNQVPGTDWSKITVNNQSVAAIKTDGTLWMWGNNGQGSLGLNDKANRSSPVQVGSGTDWSQIGIVNYGITALKTDGSLWSWGSNNFGQLGHGDPPPGGTGFAVSSPIQIPGSWSFLGWGTAGGAAVKP